MEVIENKGADLQGQAARSEYSPPPGVFVSVADKRVTEAALVSVADKGLTGR